MAFYCESCKFIYPKKYANCPKCGDQIKADSLTDDNLLSNGYTLYGAKKNTAPSSSAFSTTTTSASNYRQPHPKSVPTSDNNTLNEIRSLFESGNTTDTVNNTPTKKNTDTTTTTTPIRPDTLQTETSSTSGTATSASDNSGGFFDNPDAPQFRIAPVEVPKIVRTPLEPSRPAQTRRPVQTPSSSIEPTYNENAFNNTTNTQPQFNTLRDRLSRFNRLHTRRPIHIPWNLIVRLLPFILMICVAIVIWVSRDLIFSTIMEFIIGLIPFALIVGAIVYLIRRLFRP